jgi:beta-lactamase regulating signal transducer with metallopeptidase domain
MNTFFSIDAATAWHVIGFALDLAIKATLALLAALAVTWGTRRRSAALRHRVWFLTYCGLFLLPVLPFALPKWQIPLPSAFHRFQPDVPAILSTVPQETPPIAPANQDLHTSQPDPDSVASSRTDDPSWSSDAATLRAAERGRPPETTGRSSPFIMTLPRVTAPVAVPQPTRPPSSSTSFFVVVLTSVWAIGVAVSLFSVLAGRRRGRQLLNSAEPVRDPRWLELAEELRNSLRVSSRVRLLESPQAIVPMATGVVDLAVLLPRETGDWPTALRRHVLIHELAHVKRRDVLQHLICRLATALYWFHPLAWYGARRMRLEREIACDDCVLMAGEHPCDYAAELVGIARQLHGITMPWAVCMASGSTLEERVRSMLDRARSHGPLSVAAARSLLIVALAAIALLAAVEPGTSSVRKPTPTQTGFVNERGAAGQSPVKEGAPLIDRTADNAILAQANDKQPVVAVSKVPASKDPTFSFAGTVVDQQGRPVADANVSLSYFRAKPSAADRPAAVSDLAGRFEFSRKKSDFADLYHERFFSEMRVVAVKQGFGFASVSATACEKTGRLEAAIHELKTSWAWPTTDKGSNVLTLVPDDLPIRGRLLTIEGRAVAGAKIAVVGVWAGENGSLDAFEAKLKEGPGWRRLSAVFRGYAQAGAMMYRDGKRWYRAAAINNERRPSIVAPVQSDADGRFTITGLGRERMAEILIMVPGAETTLKFVRTRRGEVLRIGGPHDPIPEQIEPSEFSLVLGPSVPIEGRVVDARSRLPLAGVRVQPTTTVFAHTCTDAEGRYRMEALPLGDNDLEIIPPKGSRYLPGGVTVKTTAGSPRAVRDIALTAGIVVHGQAIDERTHQPVSGSVQYFAFKPNPLLDNTDSLDPLVTWNTVPTDSEGRFEIAALPGPGILAFEGAGFKRASEFPRGVGADRIQGPVRDGNDRYKVFRTVPEFCRPNNWNLVVPLDPRADDREVALDLKLRSGAEVTVHLIAFDGQPLSVSDDCVVHGARERGPWQPSDGDHFTVVGYFPTETRRLDVYYPARNLVGRYDLTGAPPATLTITLRPGATIAGRVLDEEGLPVRYAPINCGDGRQVTADAQGRFELKGLLPGSKYNAWTALMRREGNRPQRTMFDLFTDVTAQEGETKQLGDLRLQPWKPKTANKNSDARTTQKTAVSEGNQAAPRNSKPADASTDIARLRLAGTVLKPNGDPAIGATVLLEGFLNHLAGAEEKWTLVAKFSADARGAFDRDFDGRWRPSDWSGVRLTAILPGYGRSITVHPWTTDLRSIVLRLADDAPVRARVLNLEGRPIAGVRVDAVLVLPSKKEWIDRWLAEIPPHAIFSGVSGTTDEKVTHMKAIGQTAPAFPAADGLFDTVAGLPSAVTDAEGKVEIRGLGRERLLLLQIVGPGIAAAKLYVLTHPTKPIEFSFNSQPAPKRAFSMYGSEFEYIAAPGIIVTGVVRDDETKKPISGAIVSSNAIDGVPTTRQGLLSAITDNDGRYRLEGLSANRRLTISVTRPDSAYFSADLEIPRSRAFEPIREDITLKRGLWAVGRAYNIKTGQPVLATVFYTPFRTNEFAQKSRRSGTRGFVDDVPAGRTDDDGRFRIPILAGRGVIALRCVSGDYVPGFGAVKSRELSERQSEIPTVRLYQSQVVPLGGGGGHQAGRRRTAHRSAGRSGAGRCIQIRGPCGAPAVGRASGRNDS